MFSNLRAGKAPFRLCNSCTHSDSLLSHFQTCEQEKPLLDFVSALPDGTPPVFQTCEQEKPLLDLRRSLIPVIVSGVSNLRAGKAPFRLLTASNDWVLTRKFQTCEQEKPLLDLFKSQRRT